MMTQTHKHTLTQTHTHTNDKHKYGSAFNLYAINSFLYVSLPPTQNADTRPSFTSSYPRALASRASRGSCRVELMCPRLEFHAHTHTLTLWDVCRCLFSHSEIRRVVMISNRREFWVFSVRNPLMCDRLA